MNARTSAASLYFCMQPSHDATKPVGEWNTGRVICKGTVVQHWLNGKKVVGFDYEDPRWAFNVDLLKKRGGDLGGVELFPRSQHQHLTICCLHPIQSVDDLCILFTTNHHEVW